MARNPGRRILLRLALFSLASLATQNLNAASGSRDTDSPLLRWLSEVRHGNSRLRQNGFRLHAQFAQDTSIVQPVPEQSEAGLGRYSMDLFLSVNGDKAIGWKDSSALIRLKQHQKEFGGAYDFSSQLYSNIDAPSRTTLYEFWGQKTVLDGLLRIKVGKIDANTEFAAVPTAGDFLNASMGFSPTMLGFPSYPEPAVGAVMSLQITQRYGVEWGSLRTLMGPLTIIEPNVKWSLGAQEQDGHISLGAWTIDGAIPGTKQVELTNTYGFYTVVEQQLWKPRSSAWSPRTLNGFAQFGLADGKASHVTRHIGGGVELRKPWNWRPADSVGLGATWVRFAPPTKSDDLNGSELALELYYRLALNRYLSFVQDIQFMHHPSAMQPRANCVAVTPRLVVSF